MKYQIALSVLALLFTSNAMAASLKQKLAETSLRGFTEDEVENEDDVGAGENGF